MKLTFSKQLHGNMTIRFIDIIVDNGMDNDYTATMVYVPTMREYVTIDYDRGIDTDIIIGIKYVANSHIELARTCTLDFNNSDDNSYYHCVDSNNQYYNFNSDTIPMEYAQFINKLMTIMSIYN